MKNFMNAVSGKKAMVTVLIIVTLCFVLDVVTSLRQGRIANFAAISSTYAMITFWAIALSDSDKKNAANENAAE